MASRMPGPTPKKTPADNVNTVRGTGNCVKPTYAAKNTAKNHGPVASAHARMSAMSGTSATHSTTADATINAARISGRGGTRRHHGRRERRGEAAESATRAAPESRSGRVTRQRLPLRPGQTARHAPHHPPLRG